ELPDAQAKDQPAIQQSHDQRVAQREHGEAEHAGHGVEAANPAFGLRELCFDKTVKALRRAACALFLNGGHGWNLVWRRAAPTSPRLDYSRDLASLSMSISDCNEERAQSFGLVHPIGRLRPTMSFNWKG